MSDGPPVRAGDADCLEVHPVRGTPAWAPVGIVREARSTWIGWTDVDRHGGTTDHASFRIVGPIRHMSTTSVEISVGEGELVQVPLLNVRQQVEEGRPADPGARTDGGRERCAAPRGKPRPGGHRWRGVVPPGGRQLAV